MFFRGNINLGLVLPKLKCVGFYGICLLCSSCRLNTGEGENLGGASILQTWITQGHQDLGERSRSQSPQIHALHNSSQSE